MKRWIAFIQLFSFKSVNRPGKTFTNSYGLSRRTQVEDKKEKEPSEFDEKEEWIKPHPGLRVKHMNIMRFMGVKLPENQEGFWKRTEEYLRTLKRPVNGKDEDFKKRKSSNFFLEEGQLKRRNNSNPQVVISIQKTQSKFLKSSHEEMGHRGENET
ncbi:hypothetical protein O181_109499 [Austropuccinia psidii MF-1]|uniref:Uncharacterized protein n=1 Tax=Austropuccinia psidii MF-1 TaxID=1389203 RepID=A0A9Q3JY76_9BASI|nr:hypothetical protein [Austropuccinia psidii MF-1]